MGVPGGDRILYWPAVVTPATHAIGFGGAAVAHGADDEAYVLLAPAVAEAIDRMPADRFSTKRLIDEIQLSADGKTAYEAALVIASEGNTYMARLIVHGQVIPGLLRRSGRVRFAGFIHGQPDESDEFHVPGWWRKL